MLFNYLFSITFQLHITFLFHISLIIVMLNIFIYHSFITKHFKDITFLLSLEIHT